MPQRRVRQPAVAGLFYPADPGELAAVVERLLAEAGAAGASSLVEPPEALIVPHAGYRYSGPVAARAFVRLAAGRGRLRRVVLVGPSHFVPFRGLALPEAGAFATPLGEVPLDSGASARLAALASIPYLNAVHAREHSLEVELPFLQVVLGAFELVPLAVGDASVDEVARALEASWGGGDTLVVASSDLSHYHPYAAACALDRRTAERIEALEPVLGPEDACGCRAVNGLLLAARRRGLAAERLDLRNSGDTAGGRGEVVGYGAWAFGGTPP